MFETGFRIFVHRLITVFLDHDPAIFHSEQASSQFVAGHTAFCQLIKTLDPGV